MMHHLARTQKNVGTCRDIAKEVKKEMLKIVTSSQENMIKKTNNQVGDDITEVGGKRMSEAEEIESENIFKKRCFSSQLTVNAVLKKSLRDGAWQAIGRYSYKNAIPFDVARSEEYSIICHTISRHGNGFKPPSYNDTRVKFNNQEVK